MEPTPIGVGFFVLVRGFPFGVFVFVSFETGVFQVGKPIGGSMVFPIWRVFWLLRRLGRGPILSHRLSSLLGWS